MLPVLYAIALLAVLLSSSFGYGYVIFKRLIREVSLGELVFFSLGLGFGVYSLVVLLFGFLGLLYLPVILVLIGGGLICALYAGCKEPSLHQKWSVRSGSQRFFAQISPFEVFLLFVALVSFLYPLVVHALVPPINWDEISYHLGLSKLYAQHHRIIYVPFVVHSNWPLNMEMLFTVSLMLGSDILVHLLILSTSALSGWGILVFSRRYFNRRVGLLALALYFSIPLVKRLSGIGLIDVALAFYAFAAVYAFNLWLEGHQTGWLIVAALLTGLAAGTKLTGAAFPLILGFILLVVQATRRLSAFTTRLRQVLLFVAVVSLMLVPWYARTYIDTGNPIWPFLYNVLGGKNWDALGDEYHNHWLTFFNMDFTLKDFLFGPWYITGHPARFGDYLGGLGPLFPIFLIFSILAVVAVKEKKYVPRLLFAVCVLYYGLWFSLMTHQVRFLIPITPLFSLIGAFSFFWLWDRVPRLLRLAVATMVAYFLIVDSPFLIPPTRAFFLDRASYVLGTRTREEFLDKIDVMNVFRYINQELPNDALVLLLPYETRGYYLEREYIWGNPISQRIIKFEQFDSASELRQELEEMGVSHIVDNPHWTFESLRYWEHDRNLMIELEQNCADPVFESNGISLYELRHKRCDNS